MEQQGRRAIGRVCPRGAESYTWQEGDTAERIAHTYATTVQALQVINPGVDFATLTAGGGNLSAQFHLYLHQRSAVCG